MRLGLVLRYDLPASIVVFLVAVPLSLAIAMASGAPVMAGLIAAIVGGIVVGSLGGAPLQVSGPAAGLTLLVAGLVEQFGWRGTCFVTAAAGLTQMALGASRIARSALAISPTVVHAMLAGIGLTIALDQVHVLMGADGRGSGAVGDLVALPRRVAESHDTAALLGLGVIGVLLIWPRLPAALRRVPGPLVAVLGATLVAEVVRLDVTRVDLPSSLATAASWPQLPGASWTAVVVAVVTLTLVASLESLLSAMAVEKLRPDGQPTDFDRELIGQGAANTLSGLLGGLPVTGVIVRSSTNVAAGARTRASAVLHGVWVLVLALGLAGLIERIPLAALAALLVMVGVSLVKPDHVRAARRHGELLVYAVTVLGVTAVGMLEGVLAGLAVSLVLMLRRVLRARLHAERAEHPPADAVAGTEPVAEPGPERWTVVAEGTLSFLAVPRLSRVLAEIPAGSVVALELLADFLDHAVVEHLRTWKDRHEASGGIVLVDDLALTPTPYR